MKEKRITKDTVKDKFFGIPNIEKQIPTLQLIFIRKVASNSDNHLPSKLLAMWFNHKRQRGGLMQTNNKYILQNLSLVIPVVDKTGALKTWAHFALNNRYW